MSCSVRDGVELEARGIPTVAVHTAVFMNSAAAHADAFGLPELASAAIRHPIAGINRDEIRQRAAEVTPVIVSILLTKEALE